MTRNKKVVSIFTEVIASKNSTSVLKKHGLNYQKSEKMVEKYSLPYTAVEDAFNAARKTISSHQEIDSIDNFFSEVIRGLKLTARDIAEKNGKDWRYTVIKNADLEELVLNSKYFMNNFIKLCTKDSWSENHFYHVDTLVNTIKVHQKGPQVILGV